MKTTSMRTVFVGLITVAVIALGTNAFAGKGMGHGDKDGGHGRHQRGNGCPYGEQNSNLTPEQQEQLDTERQAFFEATGPERQDLYAKRLELRAEMAKRTPDMQKAAAIQKEVTDLQGSLDQKHLTHIMTMRKINPDAGRGCYGEGRGMGGHGSKHGMGMGMGMGTGPGSCRE